MRLILGIAAAALLLAAPADALMRNQTGQLVGRQMTTLTDGSEYSGSVVVYVTCDGGTQVTGSGSVQHDGRGHHTYFPTQAETDCAHAAFTFTGIGAITRSVDFDMGDAIVDEIDRRHGTQPY